MIHRDVAELLGAAAVDAATREEHALVARHVEHCRECRDEFDGHLETAASLAGVGEPAPSAVWEGIAAQLQRAPVVALPSIRRASRWRVVAVAAMVAALALGGVLVAELRRGQVQGSQLVAAERRLAEAEAALADRSTALAAAASYAAESPDAVQVALAGGQSDAAMTIVLTPDGTGYVIDSTLPPLPQGRTYQLWAVVGDEVISAGVLGPNPQLAPFSVDLDGLQALAITEEAAGGVAVSENPILIAWSN